MVRNKHGVYGPKQKRVVILWDLDNKPPRGPPYQAAMALKTLAQHFGDVVHVSAYGNRHAFVHLPTLVVEQRRERKHLDILERRGDVTPAQPYVCGVCGRKCKSNVDLTKHFKQLHEREREKKLNRMRSLRKAREASLGTVVVGDVDRALGRHADVWVVWGRVEKGEVSEKDLVPKMRRSVFADEEMEVEEAEMVSDFGYGGGSDELDNVVDDLVGVRSQGSGGMRISAFSEGELEEGDWEEDYEGSEDGDYVSEGEDVDSDDEDGFF